MNNNITSPNFEGIRAIGANFAKISNNIIVNPQTIGIVLNDAITKEVSKNKIINSHDIGISSTGSFKSLFTENIIQNSGLTGLRIIGADRSTIVKNQISDLGSYGISLQNSNKSFIMDNLFHDLDRIINIDNTNTSIISGNSGFNIRGIFLANSKNNTIENNYLHNLGSSRGIPILSESHGTIITSNQIKNTSTYSIYIDDSNDFTVNENNFLGNNELQKTGYSNSNQGNVSYNYWDNWRIPDDNSDGIVDLPNIFDGGAGLEDVLPRTNPIVLSPYFSPFMLTNFTVLHPFNYETISNEITISWSEVIHTGNFPVFYNLSLKNLIDHNLNILVTSHNTTTFSFDSTEFSNGEYLINITAWSSDNLKISNIIYLTITNPPFNNETITITDPVTETETIMTTEEFRETITVTTNNAEINVKFLLLSFSSLIFIKNCKRNKT